MHAAFVRLPIFLGFWILLLPLNITHARGLRFVFLFLDFVVAVVLVVRCLCASQKVGRWTTIFYNHKN
jgi:hypothetical protein